MFQHIYLIHRFEEHISDLLMDQNDEVNSSVMAVFS